MKRASRTEWVLAFSVVTVCVLAAVGTTGGAVLLALVLLSPIWAMFWVLGRETGGGQSRDSGSGVRSASLRAVADRERLSAVLRDQSSDGVPMDPQ